MFALTIFHSNIKKLKFIMKKIINRSLLKLLDIFLYY